MGKIDNKKEKNHYKHLVYNGLLFSLSDPDGRMPYVSNTYSSPSPFLY